MFVAVAAFVVVSDLQRSEVPLQQNTVAKETGNGFVTILTLSLKGGQGFSYNYTFPKTLFGLPYRLDMRGLQPAAPFDNATIVIDWAGNYGNFSYAYDIPRYNYRFAGTCMGGGILDSANCSNVLMLNNDGENLTLTQLP